jgi:hypothetical protein
MKLLSGGPERIAVLAVGSGSPEFARLLSILNRAACRVLVARVPRPSQSLLGAVSVVICEDTLQEGTWRDLLDALNEIHSVPRLIVTSASAEPRLWAEVLNLGGYDVLAQPFSRDEVLWSVQRAHEATMPVSMLHGEQNQSGFTLPPASVPENGQRCAHMAIDTPLRGQERLADGLNCRSDSARSWSGTCSIGSASQGSTLRR